MTRRPLSPRASLILHSKFQRGATTVSCDLHAIGRRQFDVSIVPNGDASEGIVESFREGAKAIRRHAELSWSFRQEGWLRRIEAA